MNKYIGFLILIWFTNSFSQSIPNGFVYIHETIPSIKLEIRYYSVNNFTGKKVDGYLKPLTIISKEASLPLIEIQKELNKQNLGLKIFDAYRPQKAVNYFVKWARDWNDTIAKSFYYPNIKKRFLFKEGYIASKSGHSRGSTLDLTIVNLKTGKEIDMGSPYDLFDPISSTYSTKITVKQQHNRLLLKNIMNAHGFRNYPKEWWHFTLRNEPYPTTYFDFDLK
ncbi:M15 family metallopeptidase [Lutibacter sp. TH_r2]|uniref:M15 family metallopeptidase n=1 Tax=Lutibacter sp. TH_r2 TaxID=3082083 RepID=UPI002953F272|nr:M15 family metallopeptidase [Lutibacter sp. TH_r2]MDV7185803.1 M15 family metallopeptidase [Lutibacter sp. TH_r2]